MKKIISAVLLFVIILPFGAVSAAEEYDYTGKDWYFVLPYTITIPLTEEFEGTTVEITANVGCIRDCGTKSGYYFDRLVSYETNIISGNERMYFEDIIVSMSTHNFYRTQGSVFVSGVLTEKVPFKFSFKSPETGLIKIDRTVSTNMYYRESFHERTELKVR